MRQGARHRAHGARHAGETDLGRVRSGSPPGEPRGGEHLRGHARHPRSYWGELKPGFRLFRLAERRGRPSSLRAEPWRPLHRAAVAQAQHSSEARSADQPARQGARISRDLRFVQRPFGVSRNVEGRASRAGRSGRDGNPCRPRLWIVRRRSSSALTQIFPMKSRISAGNGLRRMPDVDGGVRMEATRAIW